MAEAGADIIELGVPFSDPMADGPVIQKAGERALAAASACRRCWRLCAASASATTRTPVVLMGYANPIERYDSAWRGASSPMRSAAGVDGVLVVDYPPEECDEFAAPLSARGIDPIFLLAPTSTEARMRAGRPDRERLRLLRVAQGRDRRRPPRHRRGRRDDPAHQART